MLNIQFRTLVNALLRIHWRIRNSQIDSEAQSSFDQTIDMSKITSYKSIHRNKLYCLNALNNCARSESSETKQFYVINQSRLKKSNLKCVLGTDSRSERKDENFQRKFDN